MLFAAFHSNYGRANSEVARIVHNNPARFYGFAFLNPARDKGRIHAMVENVVTRYGFCGIKVHRHDARITREVCDAAGAFSLPVIYDVTGEVSVCELLADEYPNVNFIIPHLGSFADDWAAQSALIDHLARHPNIYADTSGVRRFDLLESAVRRAGARKILFGSDGPWLHPLVEISKIYALNLPEEDEKLILGRNFLTIDRAGKPNRKPLPLLCRGNSRLLLLSLGKEAVAAASGDGVVRFPLTRLSRLTISVPPVTENRLRGRSHFLTALYIL